MDRLNKKLFLIIVHVLLNMIIKFIIYSKKMDNGLGYNDTFETNNINFINFV